MEQAQPSKITGSPRHRMKTPAALVKVGAMSRVGVSRVTSISTSVWMDFVKFVGKGNIIQLAIAFIVGNLFQSIITSLVNDIITPLIGLGPNINFNDAFVILRRSTNTTSPTSFNTPQAAKEAGNVVMTYGNFLTVILNFIIVASTLFLLFRIAILFLRKKQKDEPKYSCDYCLNDIKKGARRCQWCCADFVIDSSIPEDSPVTPAPLYDQDSEPDHKLRNPAGPTPPRRPYAPPALTNQPPHQPSSSSRNIPSLAHYRN